LEGKVADLLMETTSLSNMNGSYKVLTKEQQTHIDELSAEVTARGLTIIHMAKSAAGR
jgi:hypothetical protein